MKGVPGFVFRFLLSSLPSFLLRTDLHVQHCCHRTITPYARCSGIWTDCFRRTRRHRMFHEPHRTSGTRPSSPFQTPQSCAKGHNTLSPSQRAASHYRQPPRTVHVLERRRRVVLLS
ncbi:uncharacterized protein B0I36DRAFT_110412 [Microdochium trichocladiopsis]|uniref:Secreted protein n=1 Tax=Microdochium trichocladiopsis TaxID=1682393 RepID=A0A9P8Y9G9_9PEZI|nr:uncharacterized protein B0I36DRAFT_110412 [Microdochium trichocladiopsis]KAH7033557.1 hypothetical protein B0I36DRAFT_110412 [Microdochium trichocladiopsis]